jgi:hypothetical protein
MKKIKRKQKMTEVTVSLPEWLVLWALAQRDQHGEAVPLGAVISFGLEWLVFFEKKSGGKLEGLE